MEVTRWEIGSMFHWESEITPPFCSIPEPANYYMLGRHALAALCAAQPVKPVVWLPSFLCPEIAQSCSGIALVREYRDDCRWAEPDWSSLRPESSDLVVAVNYFGVRPPEPWTAWKRNVRCVLVEDHTQDPFSSWATGSTADYAFASLRKTIPVPDGAILWSPVGHALPRPASECDGRGTVHKMAAMLLKREYLRGTVPAEDKQTFREWQLRGENELSNLPISAMSPLAHAVLARGIPKLWREKRAENARIFLSEIAAQQSATPVFKTWPEGLAPFDVPMVFKTERERDACQRMLQRENIFCPVEWPCGSSDETAVDLSSRIMSIPVDHRYDAHDMRRVARALIRGNVEVCSSQSTRANTA